MPHPTPDHAYQLAANLHREGRANEAESLCQKILATTPHHAKTLHLLGIIAHQSHHNHLAAKYLRQAIAADPNHAPMHSNLANILTHLGDLDAAIAEAQHAIALNPNSAPAHSNLGNALRAKGLPQQAADACRKAISLNPNLPEAHSNLGNALGDLNQLDPAIAAYQEALRLDPAFAGAYNNLATALIEKCQPQNAAAACQTALALDPDFADAHANLATALQATGNISAAQYACTRALQLDPHHASAHLNLAGILLALGDYPAGWKEYEWRWQCHEFLPSKKNFPQPQWDGSPLQNRTLLLHAEQGLGDSLQFIRYLPLIPANATLLLECQPELQRLLQSSFPTTPTIPRGQPLPPFDLHAPLMSLPHLFATTLQTVPQNIPYLRPDPQLTAAWHTRLATSAPTLRIGLTWAGNPKHRNDPNRSLPLAALAPLLHLPQITYYSLQKNRPATDPLPPQLIDLAPNLQDFADTAALLTNLDLIISVDTAVAHLAGALAKPVYTLLPHIAEWRWMQTRPDSPWYPTMQLFRQPAPGNWQSVIQNVAAALTQFRPRNTAP